MTREAMRLYTRWLIDEQGLDWLPDDSETSYDLDTALSQALIAYALVTKCFRSDLYTLTATIGTAIYPYSAFTIGTGETASDGGRIFEPTYVMRHDSTGEERELHPAVEAELCRNWRSLSGTPHKYLPWGTKTLRLTPNPSAALTIGLEGYETPDTTVVFTQDTDEPPIDACDHDLLGLYAAVLLSTRNPSNESNIRDNKLFPVWDLRTKAAAARIHEHKGRIVIGRKAARRHRGRGFRVGDINNVES